MNSYIRSLALATVSAMAVTVPATGNAVEVYGKAILALESVDQETNTEDFWQVASYDSRLGVKGDLDTDIEGMKAIYNIEWQIDMADRSTTNEATSSNNHISARNQWVGLKGNFGEFIIGRNDTPLKRAQGKVDLFNDRDADIKFLMGGGENRSNNIFQYTSPKIADAFTISIMGRPGEQTATPPAVPGTDLENGLADATSISLTYNKDSLYLALALDSDFEGADTDTTRIVGQWTADNFAVGLLQQTTETPVEDEEILFVSAYYNVSDTIKLKVQNGTVENYDGLGPVGPVAFDGDATTFGVDFALSKKTILGVLVAKRSGGDVLLTDELSRDTFGVNLEHNFD